MKQIVLNYSNGQVSVEDVPVPICRSGNILVRTAYSLVSAGTEGMKAKQAKLGLIQMAKARPDKVKQVIQSVKQAGVVDTYRKVRERLDSLTPLGYSMAGTVEDIGIGIDEFAIGDPVACAGETIACHAEFVSVPRNMCVHVPGGVDLKDAAFGTVGAIALNGVRQAGVSIGDRVVIIGLGLVGLLAVQILKAAGCCVVGIDIDPKKLHLAEGCGADLAVARGASALTDAIYQATDGIGADAVYISASSQSTDPMDLAGQVVRDRGKVVVVGMVPVHADWQTYYKKEVSVLMARSYGPGRYDPTYEVKGVDYPIGYVRWTERRNMAEFLRLICTGQVNPSMLAPEIFKVDYAPEAYRQLREPGARRNVSILFEYPHRAPLQRIVPASRTRSRNLRKSGTVGVGMIGAGNFSTGTLIPALKKIREVRLHTICSGGGLSAASSARRHGFEHAASDYEEMLKHEDIDAVVVATRHDTHARFGADCLRAGKHVFVEKPLALTEEQLQEIAAAHSESERILMLGLNRRFSPLIVAVRNCFSVRSSPIEVLYRVNAGRISSDSWYKDDDEGGWRVISEGCHFIDVIQFLCGCPPRDIFAQMIEGAIAGDQNDSFVVTMKMEDGSVGNLMYVANGDASFDKERIEVFGQGRVGVVENFRQAHIYQNGKRRKIRSSSSGKGHAEELAAFIQAVRLGKSSPLPFEEAMAATRATFQAAASMRRMGERLSCSLER